MDDDDPERLLAVLALLFVLLLVGCSMPGSVDGKGELTAIVRDRDGNPVRGKTVIIKNQETGEQVFQEKRPRTEK